MLIYEFKGKKCGKNFHLKSHFQNRFKIDQNSFVIKSAAKNKYC